MFTDLLNLAQSASDRASQSDQVLSLSNMSWSDYEQLTGGEYLSYRAAYFDGVITIVSPSRNQEKIAEIINGLVKTYCRKFKVSYFPLGSMTLKNPPLAGKEPDHSFAFGEDKSLPDLAIEVNFTNGGLADLEKYQSLGIKEVWFWANNEITFYRLQDSGYVAINQSACLPNLSSDFLISFVNRGLSETPLIIEADFFEQL